MADTTTVDDKQHLVHMLYDVLDDIFKYLNIKSLRNVALVSRSWNEAAKRAISKRGPGPLFRLLLPVLYNTEEPKFDLNDYFVSKPNTVLMFCGPQPSMRSVLNLEYKIMGDYYQRLPGRIIMLGVDQAIMDTMQVCGCKVNSYCRSNGSLRAMCDNIMGLVLPESEDITIKVAECVSHEHDTEEKAESIYKVLQDSAEGVENPIFLLFSRSGYSIGRHFTRMFQEKYAGKPVSVWGGMISDFIKRSDDGYPTYRGTHGFLGILLHGPRLRAHCLVVPIGNNDESMAKILSEFKGGLMLRRRSVGLVCGPQEHNTHRHRLWRTNDAEVISKKYYNADSLMKLVKHEFSTIDFTGMFNDEGFSYYGCDHTSKDGDYSMEHKGALSIMILTYD